MRLKDWARRYRTAYLTHDNSTKSKLWWMGIDLFGDKVVMDVQDSIRRKNGIR